MAQQLSEFMNAFQGGLRPNKFRVNHNLPNNTPGSNDLTELIYMVRAASMPASTMTTINVPYRGRIYKMPGIRTYATWRMTVLDDSNNLYLAYHRWSNAIKEHRANTTISNDMDFSDLMTDITVTQLDYNGNDFRNSVLRYAWPSNVGPIELDMDNNETIVTFSVEFEYQWMEEPGRVEVGSITTLPGATIINP
jgi:hypothetical protein